MKNSYKKNERLKHDKKIEQVFRSSSRFIEYPIRVNFVVFPKPIITGPSQEPIQTLVGCSKKGVKKAVHRNRIKRLIKEMYRTQNSELKMCLSEADMHLGLSLIFIGKKMPDYEFIEKKIKTALARLTEDLFKIDQNEEN